MLYGLCLTFCVSISDWFGWWIDQSICWCRIHRGRFGSTTSIAATNALTVVPIARREMATNIAVPCFSTLSYSFLCTLHYCQGVFLYSLLSRKAKTRFLKDVRFVWKRRSYHLINLSRKHNKNPHD